MEYGKYEIPQKPLDDIERIRMINAYYDRMTMPKQTMTRRFYASQSAIHAPHIRKLMVEALDDVRNKMAKDESINEYYIVEIVKVVRRKKPEPILPEVEVIEVE